MKKYSIYGICLIALITGRMSVAQEEMRIMSFAEGEIEPTSEAIISTPASEIAPSLDTTDEISDVESQTLALPDIFQSEEIDESSPVMGPITLDQYLAEKAASTTPTVSEDSEQTEITPAPESTESTQPVEDSVQEPPSTVNGAEDSEAQPEQQPACIPAPLTIKINCSGNGKCSIEE